MMVLMMLLVNSCKFLRSQDRELNGVANFPRLFFPEVYLMKEGYKTFFTRFPQLCEPRGYVPMDDPQFASELACVRRQDRFGK